MNRGLEAGGNARATFGHGLYKTRRKGHDHGRRVPDVTAWRRSYIRVIGCAAPRVALTMSTFPDYYKLLNVPQNASIDDIRTAYKKESLKCAIHGFLGAM